MTNQVSPLAKRRDHSSHLIHFTKESEVPRRSAVQVLTEIARSRQLRGGTKFIKGSYPCVCFTEAPYWVMADVFNYTDTTEARYSPFGVMVEKQWLYQMGGRPVFYMEESEYAFLDAQHQYRYVKYDLNPHFPIDFTWEREWRVRTDVLEIGPSNSTLIFPTRAACERFTWQWERDVGSVLDYRARILEEDYEQHQALE